MILSIPAIFKVLLVFVLILALNKARLSLSLSLIAGSLALGFWMNLGPVEVADSILKSLAKLQTISLILIVAFILVLSRLMQESRHLDLIGAGFLGLSRDDRTAGVMLPALIGLLPMPAGALFSAPMVETALCRNPMTGEQRTAVNYWFRHIWDGGLVPADHPPLPGGFPVRLPLLCRPGLQLRLHGHDALPRYTSASWSPRIISEPACSAATVIFLYPPLASRVRPSSCF